MSADNTILVIKTKRTALEIAKGVWQSGNENYVYRVAHVQAADNLTYYKTKENTIWGSISTIRLKTLLFFIQRRMLLCTQISWS